MRKEIIKLEIPIELKEYLLDMLSGYNDCGSENGGYASDKLDKLKSLIECQIDDQQRND